MMLQWLLSHFRRRNCLNETILSLKPEGKGHLVCSGVAIISAELQLTQTQCNSVRWLHSRVDAHTVTFLPGLRAGPVKPQNR